MFSFKVKDMFAISNPYFSVVRVCPVPYVSLPDTAKKQGMELSGF